MGAEVDLLLVGVEGALGEEVDAAGEGQVFRGDGGLGEERGIGRVAGAAVVVVVGERGAQGRGGSPLPEGLAFAD